MEFRQLSLPVSVAFSRRSSDFVVSECNSYAFSWLEKWPFGTDGDFVCLVGEKGAGKTHLASLWAARVGADFMATGGDVFAKWVSIAENESEQKYYVLDDADEIKDDLLLFYIYNTIKEKNAYLLLTSKNPPCFWGTSLLDVKSRISTINVVKINSPNDDAVLFIIEKMLKQRGMLVKKNVVEYIANTIDRSYESLNYWIDKIDKSMAKGQKISLQLVKKIIDQ